MNEAPAGSTHLVVRVEGVVLPTWAAACAAIGAFIACLTLAVVLLLSYETLVGLRGEIRVLQLGVGDVQDVLIRQGVAQRNDFIRLTPKGDPRDTKP